MFDYLSAAQAVLGTGATIAGGIIGGKAANKRRAELKRIAETPGVSLPGTYTESLNAAQTALPAASTLASDENRLALEDLQNLYETSIPGYRGIQSQRVGNAGALIRGEIPLDVSNQVYRGSTARALESGYGGSPYGRNLVARDLGLTSLNLMNMGGQQFNDILRSTPMPRIAQASDYLDIGAQDTLALREAERMKRLDMLTGAANAPTSSDVWARALQDMGGQMTSSAGGFGAIMGRK